MDKSVSSVAPLLVRNLLTWTFVHADKSLFFFSEKFQIIQRLRSFLVSAFLFFIGLLPYFFSSLIPNSPEPHKFHFKSTKDDQFPASIGGGGTDSGVSRALSQLLLIMNDIPVSSRKYEVVRSLVEKLIDENLLEGNQALREVNCAVLSAAFARSLAELEVAMERDCGGGGVATESDYMYYKANRFIRGVKYYGSVAWRYAVAISRSDINGRSGCSAEKLAAELLWLSQKMAASGCAEEAVCKWASASNVAWLALTTEPRLQCSLVKVSAFLIKQAKDIGEEEVQDETRTLHVRQTKMKMLLSWLPLLCRANNGTDSPILSMAERAQLENILEEMIETLDAEEEQETVLSLWLHHFTYCSVSDWPNLRSSYTQWYSASRARLTARVAQPEPTPI
ncbi:hypothetical protein ACS0TY_011713 [Phlomoides rotata]